jgi:uncharacterized peroxidase-related enzyme
MAHIQLPPGLPGIRGPMAFRPETARPLSALADVLLHGPSTLTPAEREMIAAHVSARNECAYCRDSHAAIAEAHCGDAALVAQVTRDGERAPVSPKLQALLAIAARVQESGRSVGTEDVARARAEGATDLEIHDTVLIAAAFCMFNRYVDGLATWTPEDPASYRERAGVVARDGYAAVLKAVGVTG